MSVTAIFKALSNEHRLQILLWLKIPSDIFAPERLSGPGKTSMAGGVCVNAIVEKIRLTQPVVLPILLY